MNTKHLGNQRIQKWMKKYPRYNRIYALGWNRITGDVECDPHDMFSQEIWIGGSLQGEDGPYLSGVNIRSLATGQAKTTQAWALPIAKFKKIVDITDWFWKNYEQKGICFFTWYTHDWIPINKHSRKCKSCGEHQARTVTTRTERRRVELWA